MSDAFERVFGSGRKPPRPLPPSLLRRQGWLHDGSDLYREFGRQRAAMALLEAEADPALRLFCRESPDSATGARRYVVANLRRFWSAYNDWAPARRHFYEVLLERRPCRLYLDLEFPTETNPDVDADAAVRSLCEAILDSLRADFGLDVSPTAFLHLHSSTAVKFSRHLILHLPAPFAFPSNTSVGDWIESLSEEWIRQRPELLVLGKDDETPTTLWDGAVYTRMRNFRLLHSSKAASPTVCLRVSEESLRSFYGEAEVEPKRLFLDSLVLLPPGTKAKLLPVAEVVATRCPPGERENLRPSRPLGGEGNRAQSGPSPHPLIDEFILAHLRRTHPNTAIRQWRLFQAEGSGRRHLLYDVSGNRFCHRIQRDHRSNHVMWMVELEKPGGFYQKCHDPDCKGFSSNTFPLPSHLLPPPLAPPSPPPQARPLKAQSPEETACDEVDQAIQELIDKGLL